MSKDLRNVKVKSGKFYISSKEPKEGFKEVHYTDKKSNQERTVYHKEFQGITGRLNKIDVYDGNFGKRLRVFMEDSDFLNVIEIPLKSPRGSIDNYTASIIRVIGNLEKGGEYRLIVNNKSKNAEGRLYKALIFLTEADNKFQTVRWSIDNEKQPSVEVKEDALGDKTYDTSKRDAFLTKELVDGLNAFDNSGEAVPVTDEVVKEKEVVETSKEEYNEDDLPF